MFSIFILIIFNIPEKTSICCKNIAEKDILHVCRYLLVMERSTFCNFKDKLSVSGSYNEVEEQLLGQY